MPDRTPWSRETSLSPLLDLSRNTTKTTITFLIHFQEQVYLAQASVSKHLDSTLLELISGSHGNEVTHVVPHLSSLAESYLAYISLRS